MFYLRTLKKDLLLEPKYFGANIQETVSRLLLEQVEGLSLGNDGFVISVYAQNSQHTRIEMGCIEYDTGAANLICSYDAICFRPFKNEVLDATVSNVTDLGFFAEVGPLEIFVSRFNMPEDISISGYDSVGDMWVSEDKEVEIKKGCGVRLRIIGITVEAELKAVGSMKDDYLGLVSAATPNT